VKYILLSLFLFSIVLLYIRFAAKYYIYDNPNQRSSHAGRVIRGGGIVFWFAALFFIILNYPQYLLLFAGLSIVAFVSFFDDVRSLGQWSKFFSHLAGFTLVFISLDLFETVPWYVIACAYILSIGILNAYNFMDGINGITGLYSLAVLGALQWVNMKVIPFTTPDFIWFPMIVCVVFLFFNFRKKALCFAGDVGSISIAFWIVTLLLMLMVKSGSIVWLLLLRIYGIDTIFTIIHRLYLKQNIFVAHRMHFYQVLANECRIDHRVVSLGYAILQLAISVLVIVYFNKIRWFPLSLMVLLPLGVIYQVKFRLCKQ
jgi:UDP-N-acetylmuramyl pentapeptide phosphotransferase/UDP-N-acetylglucosamine-1-phosphate transferase